MLFKTKEKKMEMVLHTEAHILFFLSLWLLYDGVLQLGSIYAKDI